MKLFYASFFILYIYSTLNSMYHRQAPARELTELVDVPMASLLIPAARVTPTGQDSLAISPHSSPGILQILHNTINRRPARTK